MQQELARPGTLERFLAADDCAEVRRCFAGMYSLDSEADVEAARALVGPVGGDVDGYVLKPQREGGGNNFFGEECRARLHGSSLEELKAFILMERIHPPAQTAVMVRQGEVRPFHLGPRAPVPPYPSLIFLPTTPYHAQVMCSRCICELGVYGVYLADRSSGPSQEEPEGLEGEGKDAQADRRVGLMYSANAGYLLRVKPEDVNEGGVAAGFAVLGCPVLV